MTPSKTYFDVQPFTGLTGPHPLNERAVATVDNSIGVYILSDPNAKSTLLACYVGRSENLRQRLRQHLGEYGYFFVKYVDTVPRAFFTECRLFHDYGKAHHLDNRIHPAVPAGSSLPACREKGCNGEAT